MTPRPSARTGRSRGGRGGAEPRAGIKAREAQVGTRLLRGMSQRAIAEQAGFSEAAVCKIVGRLTVRHETGGQGSGT